MIGMKFNYEFKGGQHSRTKYVIYLITNTVSNKYYIGQTRRELKTRWKVYKNDLLKPIEIQKRSGTNIKLKNSVQKHYKEVGHTDFLEFSILEIVDVSNLNTEEEKTKLIDEREIYYIKEFRKQFGKHKVCNVLDGGRQYIFTEEDKINMSNSQKLFWEQPENQHKREEMSKWSKEMWENEEYKKAHTGENHPMYGKQHKEESKQKMSENRSGELNHFYGKHHTEETKEKLRNKVVTEKTRKNMSIAQKNKKMTEEKKKAVNLKKSKTYNVNLINENTGEIVYGPIVNLNEFCRNKGLTNTNLSKVIKGEYKQHKGWKLYN